MQQVLGVWRPQSEDGGHERDEYESRNNGAPHDP